MQLRHAPIVEQFAALIVSRKCVRQLSALSTLGIAAARPPSAITVCALPSRDLHTTPRSRLARALRLRLEARAARADDEDIMFVSFVLGSHRIRMSFNAPEATKRIYKSVRPTEIMLTHAQNM